MTEEWSNWIEHDGKSCPVEGQYVQAQFFSSNLWEGLAGEECKKINISVHGAGSSWTWSIFKQNSYSMQFGVKSYRIRKPKGMQVLDAIMNFFSIDKKITEDA